MNLVSPGAGLLAGVVSGAMLCAGAGRVGMVVDRLRAVSGLFLQVRVCSSDDERGLLLRRTGVALLLTSLGCLVYFTALSATLLTAPVYLAAREVNALWYWVVVTIVATATLIACRRRSRSGSGGAVRLNRGTYGLADRALCWIALEPSLVRRVCFDFEAAAMSRRGTVPDDWYDDRPVYVCGMARSGTTMLLRILSALPEMRSLSYGDMPFVLSPGIWRKLSGSHRIAVESAERAHGDGILVDLDSPEAFEEVFWRTFSEVVVTRDRIWAAEPTSEAIRRFETYRRIVVASTAGVGPGRYLSKNNNNLIRLPSLASDPRSSVVLAYRDPFSTARSSHVQHLRFCSAQREDPFVRSYMRWLVHHEFGLDHRPLGMVNPALLPESGPGDLDYWLAYWIALHRYLLETRGIPMVMLDHARLRSQPEPVLAKLFEHLRAAGNAREHVAGIRQQSPVTTDGFSKHLVAEAEEVYESLRGDPRNLEAVGH